MRRQGKANGHEVVVPIIPAVTENMANSLSTSTNFVGVSLIAIYYTINGVPFRATILDIITWVSIWYMIGAHSLFSSTFITHSLRPIRLFAKVVQLSH
jgi:hypothetical protein